MPYNASNNITVGGDWLPLVYETSYVPPSPPEEPPCNPRWKCGAWSDCESGIEKRTCNDDNMCGKGSAGLPPELENCSIINPNTCEESKTCFKNCVSEVIAYGNWSSCTNGIQEREVTYLFTCEGGVSFTNVSTSFTPCSVKPLTLIYSPLNLELKIPVNETLEFSVKAIDKSVIYPEFPLIKIRWYVDEKLIKEDASKKELESKYLKKFESNTTIKAEAVQENYSSTNITWKIETLPIKCIENWKCNWTHCDENYYKYPVECVDLNKCGTNWKMPGPEKCYCRPNLTCTEWSECKVDYEFSDVFQEKYIKEGKQKRVCNDTNFCLKPMFEEYRICSISIPISVKSTRWCNETFIEIYTKADNRLVSRLREKEALNISRVELSLVEPELKGYCSYCFDGIKNYDEEGVDCGGGNCPECIPPYPGDKFAIIKIIIEVLITLGIAYFIFSMSYDFIKILTTEKEVAPIIFEAPKEVIIKKKPSKKFLKELKKLRRKKH
ncbi:MAG: hypothetical protein QXF25_02155, partial [Candidatus Pacearchaeota archaeon]